MPDGPPPAENRRTPRMTAAYVNRIATAVPPHDVHAGFARHAAAVLDGDGRRADVFARMAARSGIEHRYSFLTPEGRIEAEAGGDELFYERGRFPGTAARMRLYERFAPPLAAEAVERLGLAAERRGISHLVVASCTGFAAPGLDLELVARCRLQPSVERTTVGFMGCYAAINALKLARHIVRSEPAARVLVVNVELCTLHLQDTGDIADLLMFLLWGDGCSAALVTGEPRGLALDSFRTCVLPGSAELMQWHVRDSGFDMVLSGQVPAAIGRVLRAEGAAVLDGAAVADIGAWAVHPGGRTVLDAVEGAFDLPPAALAASRQVLRRYGNMSSATVMFVLRDLMMQNADRRLRGCAMAFGPGLTAETMLFRTGIHPPASRAAAAAAFTGAAQ